jgi:hypothetical protein
MSETDNEGRNPTQERIDREGASPQPADAEWEPKADEVGGGDDYDMTERDRGPSEAA